MIEYQEVRIGSTDHYTTDLEGDSSQLERGIKYAARTLCGIAVAGTPSSPTSLGPCNTCQALLPCDECDHPGTTHLWAPAYHETLPKVEALIYDQATCWAENICQSCNPTLHAQVLGLIAAAE